MKKFLSVLLLIALTFTMVACSAEEKQVNANSDEFLKDMASGIDARLTLDENTNTGDMTDEEIKSFYLELVNCELEKILKYENSVFDDSKLTNLAHTYIEALKTQKLSLEYYSNDDLYSSLWDGGRTIRAGSIIELYKNYNLPISKKQAESYASNSSVIVDVDGLDEIDNIIPKDDDVVLKDGDLIVLQSEGKYDGDYFDYSFTVKNNSNFELKSISVNCSICDNDGNILGTDSEYLYATILSGKQGTIKGSINEEDIKDASYIIVDSYYYDGNGNNTVFELYTDKENAEQTKIIIPLKSDVTESNTVGAGIVTQPSDESIKEQSIDFNYDEFVANPLNYEGKYVCLKGQILAKESAGTVMMIFRVDTTPDSFSSDDKIVHITYIDDYIDSSAYKVGDSVTIYGEFTGIGTYDTAYAQDVEMPKISADIVEIS